MGNGPLRHVFKSNRFSSNKKWDTYYNWNAEASNRFQNSKIASWQQANEKLMTQEVPKAKDCETDSTPPPPPLHLPLPEHLLTLCLHCLSTLETTGHPANTTILSGSCKQLQSQKPETPGPLLHPSLSIKTPGQKSVCPLHPTRTLGQRLYGLTGSVKPFHSSSKPLVSTLEVLMGLPGILQ